MNELLFYCQVYNTLALCPKYNLFLISKERPRHELKSAAFTTHNESRIQITFLNNSSVIYFFKNVSRILLTLLSCSWRCLVLQARGSGLLLSATHFEAYDTPLGRTA